MPLPALIGAGAAFGLAGLNQAMNRENMSYQTAQAKELMRYQYDNFMSPYAQAKSYADAGISPAQAFGSGGSGQLAQSYLSKNSQQFYSLNFFLLYLHQLSLHLQ